jgi:hypothetical protein
MGPAVPRRACAVLVSALLASLLAPSAGSGPFQAVSPAVAAAQVDKDPPDRPPLPDDPAPTDPAPRPQVPTEPELPPAPDLPPAPELPPPEASPAPAPAPDPSQPPSTDPPRSAPAPAAPSTPVAPDGTGSSQRGPAFSGGATVNRATSGPGGAAAPLLVEIARPSTPAGLGLLALDRRGPGDAPLAASGFDGWSGTSLAAPAIGGVPADPRSGVKGVTASGGGSADSARSDTDGSDGTLSPFGRESGGGLIILLGLLLALALLVRRELPRR